MMTYTAELRSGTDYREIAVRASSPAVAWRRAVCEFLGARYVALKWHSAPGAIYGMTATTPDGAQHRFGWARLEGGAE